MTLRSSLFVLFASLSVFAVGCAGADASAEEPQAGETAEMKAAHHALSQELLCAAVAEAEQANGGLAGIAFRDLKGDAKRDFKEFQEGMEDDFPSEAFALPVKLGNKTFDFILVVETNDGGGQMGIYRTDGSTVATESSGESSPFTWSSPADKCGG